MLAQPGDAGGQEHPPEDLGAPLAPGRRVDLAGVPVGGNASQGLAGQDPSDGLADQFSLGVDQGQAVGGVAERAGPAASDAALLGGLQGGPLDAAAPVV